MIAAVRAGASQRSVARRFRVGLRTVQRWLARAGEEALEKVDWADRSRAPHHQARQTAEVLEDEILRIRRELRETSLLGEYGADAIAAVLGNRSPSVRTIGRILERRGALDARGRVRRPPPPPGWYLPDLAARRAELDSFDIIEGLRLRGGFTFDVLTGISLHGGLTAAWPEAGVSSRMAVGALTEHWRSVGLPTYAQFDNDTRFAGSHGQPDVLGPVVRLCLGLGVVPVFSTPREMGFQGAIESFNGRWQAKFWARVWTETLADVQAASAAYIAASRVRSAVRIEAAPARAAFPADWQPDPKRPPAGRVIYLRRTNRLGVASLLGHAFPVDPLWPSRLVRAELDLDRAIVRFFALRRREPTDQALLNELPYVRLPPRRILGPRPRRQSH